MADPNTPIPTYPITAPSSALTFADLITEVAYKIGCAYYGSDGTGAPQVPVDAHDLAVCQRIVNKAVRMFINDGPQPNGWKWLRPVAQVDLWPQISYDSSVVPQYYVNLVHNTSGAFPGTTTLTLTSPGIPNPLTSPLSVGVVGTPAFYPTMELRTIYLNGNPPPNTAGFFIPNNNVTGTAVTASITRTTTVATVTVPSTVGYAVGNSVVIAGANQSAYNGTQIITGITNGTKFTFTVAGSPTTPATGTITSTFLGQVGTPFTVLAYLSPTQIVIDGDATTNGFPTNCPFSFACAGDYTLSADFGGQYVGEITFIANTNRGSTLQWIDEGSIRSRRQNYNIETGTPYEAAVRLMPTPSYRGLTNTSGLMTPRRRWELMTWRISSDFLSVLFPYTLAFQNMVNLTDVPPSPFAHDEALKAACLAIAEKEVEDTIGGPDWQYYQSTALPASKRIDAMASPKSLGYFGNPSAAAGKMSAIQSFRNSWYQRPTVPVFGN